MKYSFILFWHSSSALYGIQSILIHVLNSPLPMSWSLPPLSTTGIWLCSYAYQTELPIISKESYLAVLHIAKRVRHMLSRSLFMHLSKRFVHCWQQPYFTSNPWHLIRCYSLMIAAQPIFLDSGLIPVLRICKVPSISNYLVCCSLQYLFVRIRVVPPSVPFTIFSSQSSWLDFSKNDTCNNPSATSSCSSLSFSTRSLSEVCRAADFLVSCEERSSIAISSSAQSWFLQLSIVLNISFTTL